MKSCTKVAYGQKYNVNFFENDSRLISFCFVLFLRFEFDILSAFFSLQVALVIRGIGIQNFWIKNKGKLKLGNYHLFKLRIQVNSISRNL
jgi:hypothetical protein